MTYEKWNKNGWQSSPIPLEQHTRWKNEDAFGKGMMVMPGTPWHRPDRIRLYLTCIEWDKQLGFEELSEGKTLEQAYKENFIEQHADDLSRGHLWVYSPIVFPKKNADNVLGIEVKGLASHGVIVPTPCIHMNGCTIDSVGLPEPAIWDKEEAFKWLLRIDGICKKHNIPYLEKNGNGVGSPLSSNIKEMIKTLTIDSTIKIENGTRHDTIVSIANSILFRHSKTKSHNKLEEFFSKINRELCFPDTLPDNEMSKIWENALEFVSRVRKQELEREEEQTQRYNDNKQRILRNIFDSDIKNGLCSNIWTVISENPARFIIASKDARHICRASITYSDSGKSQATKKTHLNYGAVTIRLLPKRVILHENPLRFLEASPQYTILFENQSGAEFTVSGTIECIISRLKEMPGYVVSSYGVAEALAAIIGAFSDDMKLEVDKTVEFEGYYYSDGDVQISRINLDEKHPRRTKQQVIDCINYLEKRSGFQVWKDKQGNTIDRRDLLASFIQWTIPGPFNFLLKQLNCKPYLKGFDMTGERDGGKSGLATEMLNMHGNPTNEQNADSIYSVSAGSANTEAKFGKAVSRTTYPLEISEFGKVEAYGRHEDLVECYKTSVDALIVRRGKKDNRTDAPFPSLSPLIINGNPPFSFKGELLKRFHVAKFSEEDRHVRDPNTPFNKFQRENKHLLRILGDWTVRYLLDHKDDLLLSRKYGSYEIGRIALNAFYEFGGYPVPEWLTRWIVDTSLEELDQDIESLIRSIFYNNVHKTLRENPSIIKSQEDLGKITMIDRIRLCIEADVWPWLRKIRGFELKYYIDSSVLELFAYRLPDLTLKKLAEKTGFKYITDTEGRRKILCTKKELDDFIAPQPENEEEEKVTEVANYG